MGHRHSSLVSRVPSPLAACLCHSPLFLLSQRTLRLGFHGCCFPRSLAMQHGQFLAGPRSRTICFIRQSGLVGRLASASFLLSSWPPFRASALAVVRTEGGKRELCSPIIVPCFCSRSFGLMTFWENVSFIPKENESIQNRLDPRANSKASLKVAETGPVLREGVLLEFQKDSGSRLLGVVSRQEGKRAWNVIDQNGNTHILLLNQIKFIVPAAENFNPADVNVLLREAELLQDPSLLEIAWEELITKNKTVNVEELSLILYGNTSPAACYSVYQMVLSNPIFFSCFEKGYVPFYVPRPLVQVEELKLRKIREEIAHRELLEFIEAVKSAMEKPFSDKPLQTTWKSNVKFKSHIELLKAYALEDCKNHDQKSKACQILDTLRQMKSPSAAINVLIQMGYFPVHVNLELVKSNLPVEFSIDHLVDAEVLKLQPPYDVDKDRRVDLTLLKVYTIDSYDSDEIDDGLSAIQLPDGRVKLWIHVADATRWIDSNSILRKEASNRCTSIYLPTETIPMFPMELARDLMSFRQGVISPAVSVSVILSSDGSIAESTVENSMIQPTYRLSYEAANELLSLQIEEEVELSLLLKAANLRNEWRRSNGALDVFKSNTHVRVAGAGSSEPEISLSLEEHMSPSARLVSEMMILCGEVIATFGEQRGISLPYRGHAQNEQVKREVESLLEGQARSVALIRSMHRAEMNFLKPIQHSSLGLSGYVQFTSPIRRYIDLLAHYQVKAVIRGENPPFSSGHLELATERVKIINKFAKKLQFDSERYWMLEYLRQQPRERPFRAVVLRFQKASDAVVLLVEVGIQGLVGLNGKARAGEEVLVQVQDAHPRKGVLSLRAI